MTCQNCEYYLSQSDDQGLCRRNPPAPVLTDKGIISFFPPMMKEGWCGEHKEKTE